MYVAQLIPVGATTFREIANQNFQDIEAELGGGGLETLTLENGWSNSTGLARVVRSGTKLTIVFEVGGGTDAKIATLGTDYRPSFDVVVRGYDADGVAPVDVLIKADGAIEVLSSTIPSKVAVSAVISKSL